jgi:hypothetical protein
MSGAFGSSQWAYSSGVAGYQIEDSLRFNDDDSAYLSRTPASASNRKTWTWSGWVKRGNIDTAASVFFGGGASSSARTLLYFSSNSLRLNHQDSGSTTVDLITEALFRDASAFYNVVFSVDTTQAIESSRVKLYVNGEQVTSFSTSTYPALDKEFDVNEPSPFSMSVGATPYNTAHFDGYMSDVYFIDGQALDPTSFGEEKDGTWIPSTYSGSYGTNGFHLEFDGAVTDSSGNGNDWTANNISSDDYVPDSPTNNFATLNPLSIDSGYTLSEGNLKAVSTDAATGLTVSTVAVTSGKYYAEVLGLTADTAARIGIISTDADVSVWGTATDWAVLLPNGNFASNTGTTPTSTSSFGNGDIVGIAFDKSALSCAFYVNGSAVGTITNLTNTDYYIVIGDAATGQLVNHIANFGQDSTFAGATTAGGNTDDNGIGDFAYAPPAGFLSLCSASLPIPTIIDGSTAFNAVLYSGTGSSNAVTGVGFQNDLLWIKSRSDPVGTHRWIDSVRGGSLALQSDTTGDEIDNSAQVTSPRDADGFTVDGNTSAFNQSGDTYVAWNWKAGGTAVSNTDGSITSQVSANVDAGFSIVSYTGTSSAGTIGHGLSSAPEMIIVKNRDVDRNWGVYHAYNTSAPETDYLLLNLPNGTADSTLPWNDTAPTSSVFSVGTSVFSNRPSENFIAYCFHSSDVCKVGSYTGNGSTDGTFVYTGFRPAWVMIKRTNNTGTWYMYDEKRDEYNVVDQVLQANDDASEITSANNALDFLSNGFKCRGSGGSSNGSGDTYIFLAFASTPFKFSTAR